MAVDPAPQNSEVEYLRTDPDLPPVGVVDRTPISPTARIVFLVLAILGAVAWSIIALVRGEEINAVWFVIAAVCTYLVAYRFYAKFIERRIVQPRDDRATPAEELENGKDYMPTDRRVLFGHHFAAIAGAGPLVGPVLAAQMGYLPGTIWIIVGVVFAGAVQDFLVLWISSRRRGRSLGQMAREELGPIGGVAAIIAVLVIMIILIAVLALVVVNALAESPWGLFSIAMTIPIALFMGVYLRYLRPGKVAEVSLIGVVLLVTAIIAGGWVAETDWGTDWFTLSPVAISWLMIAYGFAASVLPVWLLLAPRDYLSTFMKVGTIVLLAIGILVARPVLEMPDVTSFAIEGNGPAFAGSLFPFLFITIACGAVSGFHALIASGTTPKLIASEGDAPFIGYGAMLMEAFVAIMALVGASILDPGIYFAMNSPAALLGTDPAGAAAAVTAMGFPVSADILAQTARDVGEHSIISRTGGAPTLAVAMAEIFSHVVGGPAMKAFWYHFAILFEALFILTAVDAGTRAGRFMLQDLIGLVIPSFRENHSLLPGLVATALCVASWGFFLYQGVTDPLGGVNTLWPVFGISNQMLAALALMLSTVVLFRMKQQRYAWVTVIPTIWLLICTLSAGALKLLSSDPAVGFLAHARRFSDAAARGEVLAPAKSMAEMRAIIFNDRIDAALCGLFLAVVLSLMLFTVKTCIAALREAKPSTSETPAHAVPAE